MADALILKDGRVVRKGALNEIIYFTTGHLASFVLADGRYTCAGYLDGKSSHTFYVQETSFYENIEAGNYGNMKKYEQWENAEINDKMTIEKREIALTGTPSYCWNRYTKNFKEKDREVFLTGVIPSNGFAKDNNGSRCGSLTLTSTALEFFNNNVILTDSPDVKNKIADVTQLINNIDKFIFEAFSSGVDLLKQNQKALWSTTNTSSLTDSQKEDYYTEYYFYLLKYYNEVKKHLYILNNSTDIKATILTLMGMHPKILVGLGVSKKIEILKYMAKELLSEYINSVNYEEFAINLAYSFESTDTDNINAFLDQLIHQKNWIPDTRQKQQPTSQDYEIGRNSATLFEALYTRMSQSWHVTQDVISWVNYIPGIELDPVKTRYNFVNAVYRLWRYSRFNPYKDDIYNDNLLSLVEENRNTLFKYNKKPSIRYAPNLGYTIDKTSGPVIINYKSSDWGFFNQNFVFEFTGNNKICALTNDWNIAKSGDISEPPLARSWYPYGYYDIYQPVTLVNHLSYTELPILSTDNHDPSGNLNNYNAIIPIFYIKYIAEVNKNKNAESFIFKALDVVDFFTSGGMAGKARKFLHIRKLSNFEKFIVFTDAISLSEQYSKNILDYAASCNNGSSEFCSKLKILLGWLELSSLGDDAIARRQKKVAAKRLLLAPVPADFNTPAANEFLQKVALIAEGTGDLNDYDEEEVNYYFDRIRPNMAKRIKDFNGGLNKEHFATQFPDHKIKLLIKECLILGIINPKFVEDMILMACRNSKPCTYDELLIQIVYYKKVILAKGFPSGFETLQDFKSYCTQAINFFEKLNFIKGKVVRYAIQGSTLFKRAEGIDPPDPTNTPYLPGNPPGDLDVQLVMTKSDAESVVDFVINRWVGYRETVKHDSARRDIASGVISSIPKKVFNEQVGGMLMGDVIFDKDPYIENTAQPQKNKSDIMRAYRAAIKKSNGQEYFKIPENPAIPDVVKIGYSIIVKDSPYDILPVMNFKKS
ncbi:MAG: hypothetical protein MUW56_04045 [Chryseobacterium sp.]|uniref:hypothetical protein n=1 Tax=Chryseobacterium sp. TaxID=1871047 RepID=UPI0025C1E0A9|nr:hypothetical protein [Chryseobacterium sp.]MCJ7932807.1 hypothetical protein [Chryseobacterium sp.]